MEGQNLARWRVSSEPLVCQRTGGRVELGLDVKRCTAQDERCVARDGPDEHPRPASTKGCWTEIYGLVSSHEGC